MKIIIFILIITASVKSLPINNNTFNNSTFSNNTNFINDLQNQLLINENNIQTTNKNLSDNFFLDRFNSSVDLSSSDEEISQASDNMGSKNSSKLSKKWRNFVNCDFFNFSMIGTCAFIFTLYYLMIIF